VSRVNESRIYHIRNDKIGCTGQRDQLYIVRLPCAGRTDCRQAGARYLLCVPQEKWMETVNR